MQFCYFDESGTSGQEAYAVMAGIVVDSLRMQKTKNAWSELLKALSQIMGHEIDELHMKDFYPGNGVWRKLRNDNKRRKKIINAIIDWIVSRKHKITFCGINKEKFRSDIAENYKLKELKSIWRFLALHQLLIIQREHQRKGAKGHTVCIFDEQGIEKEGLFSLYSNPPAWVNKYCSKKVGAEVFTHIIDAPYFGDSKEVHALQIADFLVYIFRRYVELFEIGEAASKYDGEINDIQGWIKKLSFSFLNTGSIYPKINKCECSELFSEYAPVALKEL